MSDHKQLSRDVYSGEVTGYIVSPEDGEKYETKFKDPSESELQEFRDLEEKAEEGDEDADQDLQKLVVNKFHLDDAWTYENTGQAWKQSIFIGFLRAIGHNDAVKEAQEYFSKVAEGNP